MTPTQDQDNALFDYLQQLPSEQFHRGRPGSPEALAEAESEFQFTFPADYRALMESSDGASIAGNGSHLHLDTLDVATNENPDEIMEKDLPGMFGIGSDGGGSLYYYDPHNKLEHGPWAVFLVPMSDFSPEESIFVGKTLTEVIKQVVAGEDFHRRPTLGKRDQ
jgi:hypothetical protein